MYQVITGNWLHRSKRIFSTMEECILHIKKIIDMKPFWISYCQTHESYYITEINTDLLPEYRKIFKEKAGIQDPDGPRKPRKRRMANLPSYWSQD